MMRIAPLVAVLLATAPAAAGNRICQTIDGRTQCVEGEGTLVCRTVNDRTECTQGPAGSMPDLPQLGMPLPGMPPMQADPDGFLGGDLAGKDVSVTILGGRVHVRSGGVDLRLDR